MLKELLFDFLKHGLPTFYVLFLLWKFAPHIVGGEFILSILGFIVCQIVSQTLLTIEIYDDLSKKDD